MIKVIDYSNYLEELGPEWSRSGRAGKVYEGQLRAGKGRKGRGRAGKGREGQEWELPARQAIQARQGLWSKFWISSSFLKSYKFNIIFNFCQSLKNSMLVD
jgi:hypothetical protein